MKKLILSTIVVLLGISVQASTESINAIDALRATEINPSSTGKNNLNLQESGLSVFTDRILSSIVKIHFDNGHCTGMFVSDDWSAVISANPYLCKRKTSILVPLSGIKKQIDFLNKKLPSLTEPTETIFRCSQR